MEDNIVIRVKLGVKDLYSFLLRYNYGNFGGIFGVIISLASFIFLGMTYASNSTTTNIILVFVGLLWTVIQPLLLLQRAAQQATKNVAYKEVLEYEWKEEGVSLRLDGQEEMIPWEGIIKVVETKKHILVYTSRIHACILPKAQFKEQLASVKGWLTRKLDKSLCKLK